MISNKKFTWIKSPLKKEAKLDKSVKSGHFYFTPDGNYYESVTTRLSRLKDKTFLIDWQNRVGKDVAEYIRQTSLDFGTKTHKIAEYYLKNKEYPFKKPLLPNAHFENLKESINMCNNIYGSEVSLWNDELQLAGTADFIGSYGNKLSIIDFKTSKKPKRDIWIEDYFFQGAFYAYSWEKITGINIPQIVILISCETGDLQIFKGETKYWIPRMKKKLNYFQRKNNGNN